MGKKHLGQRAWVGEEDFGPKQGPVEHKGRLSPSTGCWLLSEGSRGAEPACAECSAPLPQIMLRCQKMSKQSLRDYPGLTSSSLSS